MRYNIITNYYNDKNQERTEELNFCILENLRNQFINNIVIMSTQAHYDVLMSICDESLKSKIIPIITDIRPSYNDYFRIISKLFGDNDNINIISNLDIIIPPEISLYMQYYIPNKQTCLALSRWDVNNRFDYKNNSTLFDRADSQDTWVFMGGVNQIAGVDYGLGVAGCDNSIAYLLEQNGYNVINPSRTIKTYHLHLTNIRNYTDTEGHAIFRIPPPYKLIEPSI